MVGTMIICICPDVVVTRRETHHSTPTFRNTEHNDFRTHFGVRNGNCELTGGSAFSKKIFKESAYFICTSIYV
jgi:hypothetical protein